MAGLKQDKVSPRRGDSHEKDPFKVVFSTALEHATLSGKCDGGQIILAKCNGFSVTIKVIKNEGQCKIAVYCLDVNNREIQNTREEIKPGAMLPIYIAPNTTDRVIAECIRTESSPECKVSMAV